MRLRLPSFSSANLLIVLAVLSLMPGAWAKPRFKWLAVIPGGLWSGLTFDSKGNLYGVTNAGGEYGYGSIFEVSRSSKGKWMATTLYSFNGDDGGLPEGPLIFGAKGNLYGVTSGGGAYRSGTVFELTSGSGSWTLVVLYSFCEQYGCPDGRSPVAGLVQDRDGNLFGTAGGGTYDLGVLFEMTRGSGGWTENVLYNFGSRSHDATASYAPLIFGRTGALYGTSWGGGLYGPGTVFRFRRGSDDWEERLLYSFCPKGFPCTDGAHPGATPVFDTAGNLYGTTSEGGGTCDGDIPCGTIFELRPGRGGRWAESVLYGFSKPERGFWPATGLVFDAIGNLYGTTAAGGTGSCDDGCGVVYKLSPTAHGNWKYSVLYDFRSPSESPPDGRLIIDSKGNLYGTAFSIVYEITP